MKTTKRKPRDPKRVLSMLQATRHIAPFVRSNMMANLVLEDLFTNLDRQFGSAADV